MKLIFDKWQIVCLLSERLGGSSAIWNEGPTSAPK